MDINTTCTYIYTCELTHIRNIYIYIRFVAQVCRPCWLVGTSFRGQPLRADLIGVRPIPRLNIDNRPSLPGTGGFEQRERTTGDCSRLLAPQQTCLRITALRQPSLWRRSKRESTGSVMAQTAKASLAATWCLAARLPATHVAISRHCMCPARAQPKKMCIAKLRIPAVDFCPDLL